MRAFRAPRAACSTPRDDGLSLIEVIAAVTIFAISAVGVLSMILVGIATSRDARNRTAAAGVASEQLEMVRAKAVTGFLTVAAAPLTTTVVTLKGLPFTVTQTAVYTPKNLNAGSCNSATQGGNPAVQPILLVTESVSWPAMRATKPVETSTLLTPPIGAYPSGTGGIDIKVVDHANAPVPNVTVTVTGTGTAILTTDSGGCAFAAYLPAGNYSVAVSAAGYVDAQELATSTQTAGVISGQVVSASFLYDRAARLDATFAPTTAPVPSTLPITVGNSGLAGSGTFGFANGVRALTPLYPYFSGYAIWAGHCPEAYPDAVNAGGTPLYPGHPATTIAAPRAGQTTAVAVPVYSLTVTVRDAGGALLSGAVVTLTEVAGAARTPCASPFNSYSLPSTTAGVSLSGVPLGAFNLTVTYAGRSKNTAVTVIPAGLSVPVTV